MIFNEKRDIILVIMLVVSLNIVVFLDIPILRQLLSIVMLGFLPGWLLVAVFRLGHLSVAEKLVLSIGLSMAFLMLFGWVFNELSLTLNHDRPLSAGSLSVCLSLVLLAMTLAVWAGDQENFAFDVASLKLNTTDKLITGFSLTFPVLSICGTQMMNAESNNIVLLVLLVFIPICLIYMTVKQDELSESVYLFVILMVALSLTLMWGLRSGHIIGSDAHAEYYYFQLTAQAQKWQLFEKNAYSTCLSITLLPAIYQSFLNKNPEYLFKLFYPLLFAVTPVAVYILARRYVNKNYAFLAAFFFMSFVNFSMTTALARTNTAILFYILAIMVFYHPRINLFAQKSLFIIFAAASVLSHYSTTYIFLFTLFLTWLGMEMYLAFGKGWGHGWPMVPGTESQPVSRGSFRPRRCISFLLVVLFFVLMFFWQSQLTAGVTFNSGINFVLKTIKSIQDVFVLESRNVVPVAFGIGVGEMGPPYLIEFFISWITIALMIIGVLSLLWNTLSREAAGSGPAGKKLSFRMEPEYLFLGLSCMAVLVFSVLFPKISTGYDLTRIYMQMTSVLAVFFVLGGVSVVKLARLKFSPAWLLVVILIPYFLSQTSFIHQVMGYPRSLILDSDTEQYDLYYVHEQEVSAARWLQEYRDKKTKIYADNYGERRLISQGMLNLPIYTKSLVELLRENQPLSGSYAYLRYTGTVSNKLLGKDRKWYDTGEFADQFVAMNEIYDNAGSVIMR